MLNARINKVHVGFTHIDPLGAPPPECDVILAGDVCYEQTMGTRMVEWLRTAASRGTRVLIGDPGRRTCRRGWSDGDLSRANDPRARERGGEGDLRVHHRVGASSPGGEPR